MGQLHQLLLQQDSLPLDKSHFLWLVTYFLRFASQLELDMDHLSDIFSIDLLCYLAWEGVRETEQFELGLLQPMADLKPCLRRLHLGVTAIREPSALIRGRGESVGLSRRAQCLAADPVSPQVETPLHHVVYRPRHWDARIPEAGAHSPSPSQDSSRSVHSTRLTARSHQQPQLAPFSPTPLPLIRPLLFPPTINPRLSPPEASVPPSF